MLHKLLRGRYLIAVLLAGLLGPCGAALGYFALQMEYTSNATIRIAPVLPKVLFENEQNSMMPMFDSFLQTQVSLIKSRRITEMAMQSKVWQEAGGQYSLEVTEEFSKNLTVLQPKRSQLIIVGYVDKDAGRAQAATKAVVDSYMNIYGKTDSDKDSRRFQLLDERAKFLATQIEGLSKQIQEVANEFGSDDLSTAHSFEVNNLQTLQTELEAAKLHLATIEAISGESDSPGSFDYSNLTVSEIAIEDARMQGLVDERRRLQRTVDEFESSLRRPEQRPEYRRALEALKSQESEIDTYAQTFRNNVLRATETDGPGAFALAITPEQLRSKVESLQALHDEAKVRTIELGRKNLQLKTLRTNMARLQDSLNVTNARIEQLSLESSVSGRITVLSDAERPTSPSNAKRRIQFFILGGLAGGGLGVGLVLLLGLFNLRIRDIEDAQDIKPRLLGPLPLLPESLNNPVEILAAAQCVHQVRTILQTRMPPQETLSLTITAPNSGAGKTSFALSLGLSFAFAGTRTLVIDGDLVGTGWTRRTGAAGRCKLGHVLRKYDVITAKESRHGLDLA
ncbi:MAG: hypothetical protein L3K26_08260, partial [Candidatus Hydrogenedentes bacterium]|nr:hypothetical protein [Candidatus Hydrogenedentota bacterium]